MALFEEKARVIRNDQVGPRLYFMDLESSRIAAAVLPGQFVHMRLNGFADHILRRPFSIFDADAKKGVLTILYQVVGEGTSYMAGVTDAHEFDLIGSIGHGWSIPAQGEHVLIVGGGVGSAPLYMLSKQAKERGAAVDVVIGAASKESLVTYDFYSAVHGDSLFVATDDGSFGFEGFCTGPVEKLLSDNSYDKVYVCGPEPLMHAISTLCLNAGVSCEVSMEKRMACGVGACLSCVVETVDGRKRACVDGPVFNAEKVIWGR